jgi:hypothetical protein
MANEWKDYLVEYPYQGERWCIKVAATSWDDARDRIRALGFAEIKGPIEESIPVMSPRGWLVPLIVWWRNRR